MRGLNNNSGVALLAVLAVISVLMAAALELARTTGISAVETGRTAARLEARERAAAGIQMALALLTEDAMTGDMDSLQEDWADPEKIKDAVALLGYDENELDLHIRDEMGKLQVNALIKAYPGKEVNPDQLKIWERFLGRARDDFSRESGKDETSDALINSMIDWLDDRDDDAVTGLSGAESDYYRSLGFGYGCGNRPFAHISELFLVKGVTPERVLGIEKAEEETGESVSGEDRENSNPLVPGDLISVHGLEQEKTTAGRFSFKGKVNINTAEKAVIRALLPAGAEDMAGEVAEYRLKRTEEGGSFLHNLDKGWVTDLVPMSDKEKERFERTVTYGSDLFSVTATGRKNQSQVSILALVHRETDKETGRWQCRILQQQVY